jgi:hypothetical protein
MHHEGTAPEGVGDRAWAQFPFPSDGVPGFGGMIAVRVFLSALMLVVPGTLMGAAGAAVAGEGLPPIPDAGDCVFVSQPEEEVWVDTKEYGFPSGSPRLVIAFG